MRIFLIAVISFFASSVLAQDQIERMNANVMQSLGNGAGKTFNPKEGEILKAGSSFVLPEKHPHYV